MCSLGSQRPRRGGFTLIELLIVMAIIAVLVSLTIPAVMKAREASNRTQCSNNLREYGFAIINHQTQNGYLPTAGLTDYGAPTFSSTTSNGTTYYNPYIGAGQPPKTGQDAGWAYQILPFMDSEPIWQGQTLANGSGSTAAAPINQMQNAIAPPMKFYFCPSRRQLATFNYSNANFPYEAAYSTVKATAMTVSLIDYAGCNGTGSDKYPSGSTNVPGLAPGNGAIVSQCYGRFTVTTSDIRDGTPYTILIAEKAANPRTGTITNEDDMGYFAAYGPTPPTGTYTAALGTNFNTIRFTSANLLPLRDFEVTGATGGAFGSAHPGTFNALMADGSVQQIGYTINSSVFQALGTIQGNEIVSATDLTN